MDTQNAIVAGQTVDLIPPKADKYRRSRLSHFQRWQQAQGNPWHKPDLVGYRDDMLANGKARATVTAYLSTVRARYRELLTNNEIRQSLFDQAAQQIGLDSPSDRKAWVDEVLTRLENAIDPDKSKVKQVVRQDVPDSEHLRLTGEQASSLLASPGVDTLDVLRDTAVIALLLCTGIREAELCNLEVRDLRQTLGDELALHVREGKGCKDRLIPYGALDWSLTIVDKWLTAAGIESGPVFRGFYKGNQKLRPGRLSVRAVEYILSAYPIAVKGELRTIPPHDCRRTYARRLHDAGVTPIAIQQNLGHADLRTTLGYIGALDAKDRRAPAIYTFDLSQLNGAPVQTAMGV